MDEEEEQRGKKRSGSHNRKLWKHKQEPSLCENNRKKNNIKSKGMQGQKDKPVNMGHNSPVFCRLIYIEMKSLPKSCFLFKKLYNSSSNTASKEFSLALFFD